MKKFCISAGLSCFLVSMLPAVLSANDSESTAQRIGELERRVSLLEKRLGARTAPTSVDFSKAKRSIRDSISRSEIVALQQNIPELLAAARAVPYFRNGRALGLRFFAVKEGRLYSKYGIQNGDIVISIDGVSLVNDPGDYYRTFVQVPDGGRKIIRLIRAGNPLELVTPISDS